MESCVGRAFSPTLSPSGKFGELKTRPTFLHSAKNRTAGVDSF